MINCWKGSKQDPSESICETKTQKIKVSVKVAKKFLSVKDFSREQLIEDLSLMGRHLGKMDRVNVDLLSGMQEVY